MTRFIESQLKTAEIDYDLDIRESDFGYASARLITYAPLPAIRSLVETKRGGDYKVIISPVRKRVEFLSLEPRPTVSGLKPKYYILGIDPGTTAAYCLLRFNGTIRALRSKKGLTRADIIREVYDNGIPAIIASDVPQPPHLIEKIASTVNAPIFTPQRPIAVSDKQELAREYSSTMKIRNAHERDALTAAVYAYRSLLPKFQQIDKKIRDEQLSVDRNYLKALVIKGSSINEALAKIESEELEPIESIPERPVVEEEPLTQERYDSLKAKTEQLESENRLLEEKIEDLQRFVEYLKFRESELSESLAIVTRENHWKIKRDREVEKAKSTLKKTQRESTTLRKQMDTLSKRLERLKGVKRLEMRGDMLAVKVIPHFTRESIEEFDRKVGLKSGDVILFEDASGGGPQTAGILIEQEIRAVVVDTPLSHLPRNELIKALIPVVDAKEVELQRVDEFAFISRGKFNQQLHSFIKTVREQARQKGEDQLVELVERYRREIER
jgi:predicted RNase H-like nuclease (RuvC/YqgF family)